MLRSQSRLHGSLSAKGVMGSVQQCLQSSIRPPFETKFQQWPGGPSVFETKLYIYAAAGRDFSASRPGPSTNSSKVTPSTGTLRRYLQCNLTRQAAYTRTL